MAKKIALVGLGIGACLAAREYLTRRNAIDLRGKVVVITGGSRGLGFLLAQEFAREGARIAICARDPETLERARDALANQPADVLAVPCDVADREQVTMFVNRVIDHFGGIDVLVNNAGIIQSGPIEAQTVEDFEVAMDVMFWGPLYMSLAVIPHMRQRHSGRIVNITSIGGKVPVPHLMPYNAAKFAAVGLSETMRAELAEDGIAVVTVVPGLMRTGSHVNALFKAQHRVEYALFSPLASLPITSMSAETAARQIVRATRRGDAEVTLSLQAQLAARVHGLIPGLVTDIMAVTNRALPGPGGIGTELRRGSESESFVSRSPLTLLGRRAAHRLNQYPDETKSSQ